MDQMQHLGWKEIAGTQVVEHICSKLLFLREMELWGGDLCWRSYSTAEGFSDLRLKEKEKGKLHLNVSVPELKKVVRSCVGFVFLIFISFLLMVAM